MPIILPLGRTVYAYLRRFGSQSPVLAIGCPKCGGRAMHQHGCYRRSAVTTRRVFRIPIYRWCCPECGKTVSVLPDFLAPYAQFVSLIREGVVRRHVGGWTVVRIAEHACGAGAGGLSMRTVTRWLSKARRVASQWTQLLAGRLLLAQPDCDLFTLSVRWQGPRAGLKALCDLGDLCRARAPSGQGHPGFYAYCNGLSGALPRL